MYKQRQGTIQANKTPSSQAFFPSKSKFICPVIYLLFGTESPYVVQTDLKFSMCSDWPQPPKS